MIEGLVGEGCRGQIGEGARLLVAREGNGHVWAPEMASPERIEVEAEADRGGRS